MPNSNSFDHLIQKALETQDYPPIPSSILQKWQPMHSEKGAKWLWILPSLVFIMGVTVGVWLAPMGLGNAFFAMQRAFLSIFNAMLESSFSWALAVVLAVVVLAMDSMRGVFKRFR
jgi:hypothetical protein